MKDQYRTLSGHTVKRELVIFEAEDANDPAWEPIVKLLQKNGYQVLWADGNYMNIVIKEERS